MSNNEVAAVGRLYVIPAAEAPIAAVLRRGPSRWWHVLKWQIDTGCVEPGAWINAILDPRGASVSVDGLLFAYFAQDYRKQWTDTWHSYWAISRLPWLTALAAWRHTITYVCFPRFLPSGELGITALGGNPEPPFSGECPRKTILLPWKGRNEFEHELERGWNEVTDEQIHAELNKGRDKSTRVRRLLARSCSQSPHVLFLTEPPREGRHFAIRLTTVEYHLQDANGVLLPLDEVEWAEWDTQGRLLVATTTGILQVREFASSGPATGTILWQHDLSGLRRPNPMPSPEWARSWP